MNFAKILLFTFTVSASSAYAQINLANFNNINFKASDGACGLHVETSGNYFSYTNIIPPDKVNIPDVCSQDNYAGCTGQTYVAECDSNGQCRSRLNGQVDIILLNDGNFVHVGANRKFSQYGTGQYWHCQ